ncbi:MAG TPA: DUF6569 family protein [Pyrinomonadaceae bacterium]|nr:DUF6569 family protein [Pyrinomonadaceae bacterium]
MNKRTFAVLAAALTFIVGVAIAKLTLPGLRNTPASPKKTEIQLSNYRLSGPYEYENLTIFLVHGPDQSFSGPFTPLQEAMERQIVIVHETGEVNELAIENVSKSEEVFVQAGDIVKGGRQDRVLAVDLIVPANSGRIPIDAFCVEHSRWSQRGTETVNTFTLTEMAPSKSLKLATRAEISQAQVWKQVEKAQEDLSRSVNADVRNSDSRSSLQLALENQKVQDSAAKYVTDLSPIIKDRGDVIGFVFAINNKLNSADVYPSNAIFTRFWPRLLKAAAIEAVSERVSDEKREPVSIAAAGDFFVGAEQGTEEFNEITSRTHMLRRDSEKGVFFETRDMDHGGAWIHRSYLMN